MDIKLELGASRLELNDEGLTIHVTRRHFTPKQWTWLWAGLTQAQEQLKWLSLPFQAVKHEGARWKRMSLDVFSLVVYLLLISPSHKLVQLMQAIDWGEIDRQCAVVYRNATHGARAYAPQVLYRMLLLMALYGLSFESSLVRQVETDLAWRWFCGFGVLTIIPKAATLCYFRQRLGPAKFEDVLCWLIQQCFQAGLVSLDEAYFDFTGEAASATPLTPYERVVVLAKALSAYVAGLEDGSIAVDAELKPILRQLIVQAAQTVMSQSHPAVEKAQPAQLSRSLERLDERVARLPRGPRWWPPIVQAVKNWRQQASTSIEEGLSLLHQLAQTSVDTPRREQLLTALKGHLCQVGQALTPVIPHAWGDLSARVGKLSAGRNVCGYLVGYLVDGAHNIIIGVVSVAANTAQAPQVKVVLDKVQHLLGRLPRRLGLDSAFDRDQVHVEVGDEPVELFITSRNRRAPKGCLGPEHFGLNPAGQLCCPAGRPMHLKYGPYKNGRTLYEGQGCATCPFRDQCVPQGKEVRRFQVKLDAHRRWLDNRAKSQSEDGHRVLGQRFAREGVFGHANTYHNGDRAPYRQADMNAIADSLTAFAINLEKLAAHRVTTAVA